MTHLNAPSARGKKSMAALNVSILLASPVVSLRGSIAMCIDKFQSFQIKYGKLLHLSGEAEVNRSLEYKDSFHVYTGNNNKARETF